MEINTCKKESFLVIGKEGSTNDGKDFIPKLWAEANSHFHEVEPFAKKDESGNILGIWGAMSDLSRSFQPWEDNFSKGLYLAGIEVRENTKAPTGWTSWTIPAYEYIYVKNNGVDTFSDVITYMKEHDIVLVGAVQEFTCPEEGQGYLFFPIAKL
jgi:predicted transcriptional regulator YdeE